MTATFNPVVSVVMPTYNRGRIIGRAVRSVVRQTFEDWELIIVDDGSSDDTSKAIESWSDPRIRYVQHSVNRGGAEARNTGIEVARGQFIAFLDSDDEWCPCKLGRQVEVLKGESRAVGLVYTGMVIVSNGVVLKRELPKVRGRAIEELLSRNVVGSCSTAIIRREVIDAVGRFDPKLPTSHDHDLWLRIATRYTIDYADGCDAIIHQEPGRERLSSMKRKKGKGFLRFYNKHKTLMGEMSRRHDYLFKMGRYFQLALERDRIGRTCYLAAIRERPSHIRSYLALLSTVLPKGLREPCTVFYRSVFEGER